MSWRIFEKWFNVAPWKDAEYIKDNSGGKFWIYWLDKSENVANLRVRYRSYPVGRVNLIKEYEDQLTLADIYIKPEFRHRGLGKSLMLEMLRWARENNFREISGIMKAHDGLPEEYIAEWYKRQGFQVVGHHIYMELLDGKQ